jgi:CBS domain-containing protein
MHAVADFLRGFPPFDAVSPEALDRAVGATEIEFFAEGDFLLKAGAENVGHAYVIRSGFVELIDAGIVIDVVGPGDMVGLPSLVSDLPPGLDVRAAEDVLTYRIAADTLLPLLEGRSALRYLARTVRARVAAAPAPALLDGPADAIGQLARPVAVVDASATIADLVLVANAADASCTLVRLPTGVLGIVTDHDLRQRVLAEGLDPATPVAEIVSAPAITAPPQTTTEDAVHLMLARGIRHLPVMEADGELIGFVEDIDLLAALSRTPVRLRRAISRSSTVDELIGTGSQIVPAIEAAIESGQASSTSSASLSALVNAVVAKTIELCTREHGLPPAPFAWLVTGSLARSEFSLSSDIDCLLAWDGDDQDRNISRWMRELAASVHSVLARCGFTSDENGVRASDPRYSRSVNAWCAAIDTWASDPASGQADIYLASLLDAKAVWGHAAWTPVGDRLRIVSQQPLLRHTLLRVAQHQTPPTGFVRDLVIEGSGAHAGTLNIKRGGLAPCNAIGRYLSLLAPSASPSTADRVVSARYHEVLAGRDAEDLLDALEIVQTTRLRHQASQVAAGLPPDDHIAPDSLATLDRRHLRDAFRVIRRIQQGLPAPGSPA